MTWSVILLAIVAVIVVAAAIWAIKKWQQIRSEIDDDDSGLF